MLSFMGPITYRGIKVSSEAARLLRFNGRDHVIAESFSPNSGV